MIYIYTVCYNTPQYIEPQYSLFKKFIQNDFEYIVFNNTMTNSNILKTNVDNNNMLHTVCNKYNIKCFDIPKKIFHNISDNNASVRVGIAIDWAHVFLFKNYSLDSIFFLIDTDAFLLRPFDIETFMNGKKLSGRIQYRNGRNNTIIYITNHVVIFKPAEFDKSLFLKYFSFMPCRLDNVACDCGGNINFIFKEMESNDFINWKNKLFSEYGNTKQQWGTAPDSKKDFSNEALSLINDSNLRKYILQDTTILKKDFPFCEVLENTKDNTIFLHMRAGTNWINYNIKTRNKILLKFLYIKIY